MGFNWQFQSKHSNRAVADMVNRRAFTTQVRSRSQTSVGFVVDEEALEQDFLQTVPFSPVNIIPTMLHTHV